MSNIPKGYNQTEAGVIPSDWKVKRIGECSKICVSRDLIEEHYSPIQDHKYRYPVYSNTVDNKGIYGYYDIEEYKGESLTVVGRGVGLGTAFKREGGFGAIGRLLVLFPLHNFDASFLTENINYRVKVFKESSGIPQLTGVSLSSYKIPLPPTKAEQTAIATALSNADAFINSLKKLIAKKKNIKQGAMQQLLTGKKRLPGFRGKWEVKKLGEIAHIDPENLGSDTNANYSFKYISLEDVDYGTLRGHTEQVFCMAPSRARRKVRKGDVLVSTVRPNLKSHLLIRNDEVDTICSTGFSVVRYKPALAYPAFIFANLFAGGIERQIESLLTGSNYPAINSSDVKALRIPCPPLPEQAAIAQILNDMESEIELLEQKLAKYRMIKQGMMQELLTGRIRLV